MTDEVASAGGDGEGEVSISTLLAEAAARLAQAGVDEPRREARLLLAHDLGLTTADLVRLPPERRVPAGPFRRLIGRRAAREPFAFITGHAGFWTLDLAVGPATLIPRADSEALIEAALALRPDRSAVRSILDLGCGTGCLLLAALHEFGDAWGIGVDRNAAACRLSHQNAARNGLSDRAAFACTDWTAALSGAFDLILSNPPYIASRDIAGLMPEVAHHEPHAALDGGPDGLVAYRLILPALAVLLTPRGMAILEIGIGQSDGVADLAREVGLAVVHRQHDLAGTVRAVAVERPRP